jgi:hypothetical protein
MLVATSSGLGACKRKPADGAVDGAVDGAASPGAATDTDAAGELVALPVPEAGADAAAGLTLHALALCTPVMNAPNLAPRDPTKASDDRKGIVRLGCVRKGQTVAVKPEALKNANCPEGWYELLPFAGAPPGMERAFVCGKYATLDANDKQLAHAPHAPNLEGPLPYDYGLNLVNGAPMYRRRPVRAERREYERGLAVGRASSHANAGAGAGAVTGAGAGAGAGANGEGSGEQAWYLAHKDRSQVSMEDLKGDGLMVMRMVKGFYLALDAKVESPSGVFWRTTDGMFVPKDFLLVHEPKVEFEGIWLGAAGEARHLPLAWITNPHVRKYSSDDDKRMHPHEHASRFSIVQLTGTKQVFEGQSYWETSEGWWFREMDGTIANPGPPPKDLAPGEKWIDVNLGRQSLVAFEGDKPVFVTIVSSGRHDDDDPAKDHRTRPGEFRIVDKYISATMDSDTATDGPYSIEDVPWIMYFDGSTALHGAFWHSRFGHERSHGCVNMTPHDARELFRWVGPVLPDGWHGAHATEQNPGTRVIVHDDGKSAAQSKVKTRGDDAGVKDE